jgi:hypothetical protein
LNCPAAHATEYYVATTGNNTTGDGTISNPWKTITKGQSMLAPGDTLFVRGGTYYESVTLTKQGTAGNPITIKAYPGETPFMDGTIPINGWVKVSSDDLYLTVLGQINPYYDNIYKVKVPASILPSDRYRVKLFENKKVCRNAIWPNQELNYGLTPEDFQSLNPNGESFGYTDRLIDKTNLNQGQDYWKGARLAVHLAQNNFDTQLREINRSSDGAVYLSSDLTCPISGSGTRDADVYAIINHPHVLDKPGEFYWVQDINDPSYYWLYLWPSNIYDLGSISISSISSDAISLSDKSYISLSGFRIYGYVGKGINIQGNNPVSNTGIEISNIAIEDNFNAGINAYNVNNLTIKNCIISRVESNGIYVFGDSSDVVFRDNTVYSSASTNIGFRGVINGRLLNNTMYGIVGGHGNGMAIYGYDHEPSPHGSRKILAAYNEFRNRANLAMHWDGDYIIWGNTFDGQEIVSSLVSKWSTSPSKGYFVFAHNVILRDSANKSLNLPIRSSSQPVNEFPEKYVFNNVLDGMLDWSDSSPINKQISNNYHTGFQGTYQNTNPTKAFYYDVTKFHDIDGTTIPINDLFVNLASYDYKLKDASPLIGKGKNLNCYLNDSASPFADFPDFDFTKDKAGKPWAATPSIGAYEYAPVNIIYGDISGDSALSAYDAALCARIAVGLDAYPTGDNLTKTDVSGDGFVTAYDAALIAQKAVGLIVKFPVE